MFDVRSRAGVIAVTTSAAVLVGLPVVAFGQVPVVDPVVNGVTNTANSIVQVPPSLPVAPAPAPAPPAAPAPVPQVTVPAPQPAAQAPAAQAPAAQAPAAQPTARGTGGSTQARGAGTGAKRSSGSGKAAARASAQAADRSAKRGARGDSTARSGVTANASGDAGSASADDLGGAGTQLATSSQEASLPEDAGPATLPFTGLQLALMVIAGLAAVAGGMALRRRVAH